MTIAAFGDMGWDMFTGLAMSAQNELADKYDGGSVIVWTNFSAVW